MSDYSLVQPIAVRCPACGLEFDGAMWLIVDVNAQPLLYRRFERGTLHFLRCPSCVVAGVPVDVPYLLFRDDAPLKLIVCIPGNEKREGAEHETDVLLSALKVRMGSAWNERWKTESIGSLLVGYGPVVTPAEWQDLDGRANPIVASLLELIQATALDERERLIRATPDLLDDGALGLLQRMIDAQQSAGDARVGWLTTVHRLLEKCNASDVSRAFTEARTLEAVKRRVASFEVPRRPQDFEEQIAAFREVLARMAPSDDVLAWSLLQGGLANRYRARPSGDRRANLELALDAAHKAVQYLSPETQTEAWCSAIAALSNVYQVRLACDKSANLERAIVLCEDALERLPSQGFVEVQSALLDTLGHAYADRMEGDRPDNVERAKNSYERALAGMTSDDPAFAAVLQNLARAYFLRMRGKREENMATAILLYEQALPAFPRDRDPIAWALAADNLATCYLERDDGDRTSAIERAIELYKSALSVRSKETMEYEWAQTTANLSTAYAQRPAGDKLENLGLAVDCAERALAVFDRERFPADRARCERNLATLLASDASETPLHDAKRAAALLQDVLTLVDPSGDAVTCRRAAYDLGRLRYGAGDWRRAHDAFTRSLEAANVLFRSAFVPASRRIEMLTDADLFDALVATCARLEGDPHMRCETLIHAEASRDRNFVELMGLGTFPPPPGVDAAILAREAALVSALRDVERELADAQILATPDERERRLAATRFDLHTQLAAAWHDFEEAAPSYVALRRGDEPTWEQLRGLAERLGPRSALVGFYTLNDEIVCLVLRAGWDAPSLVRLPISRQKLVNRYLLPYEREVLDYVRFRRSGAQPGNEWTQLGEELLRPLEDDIGDAELVYFVPHGQLHAVPLHALTVGGAPFIERHAVAYAPSCGVALRVLTDTSRTGPSGGTVFGFTPSADEGERRLFLGEARAVAGRFGIPLLLDEKASSDALRNCAANCSFLHFSCHGSFVSQDPMSSGLRLADGFFTAREWMELRLRCELVTLSACESGSNQVGRGDEVVGLNRALLYAGASSALLTLWSVAADTTLEWMLDFYARTWDESGAKLTDKAIAHQAATLELRKRHPEAVAWAPFVLLGDWR